MLFCCSKSTKFVEHGVQQLLRGHHAPHQLFVCREELSCISSWDVVQGVSARRLQWKRQVALEPWKHHSTENINTSSLMCLKQRKKHTTLLQWGQSLVSSTMQDMKSRGFFKAVDHTSIVPELLFIFYPFVWKRLWFWSWCGWKCRCPGAQRFVNLGVHFGKHGALILTSRS